VDRSRDADRDGPAGADEGASRPSQADLTRTHEVLGPPVTFIRVRSSSWARNASRPSRSAFSSVEALDRAAQAAHLVAESFNVGAGGAHRPWLFVTECDFPHPHRAVIVTLKPARRHSTWSTTKSSSGSMNSSARRGGLRRVDADVPDRLDLVAQRDINCVTVDDASDIAGYCLLRMRYRRGAE
jgi:hypothetical protein